MDTATGDAGNSPAKSLLLVEDEAIIALSEAKILSRCGYTVLTAYSGQQAIDLVRSNDVDLILMDIDLGTGKMDGTRAAQIILQERDIPVVFLSSHTEPEVVEKTDKITAYGYVVKNTGETVLTNAIKMAFKLFEAKEQLQRNERTLKAALDNSHAGIAIADAPDGTLRYVNQAGLRIRGGDSRNIVDGVGIGKYVSSWNIKDLDGRPLEPDEVPLSRALLYGETGSREFIVEREDHQDRVVIANAAPIFSSDGRVESAIVIFLDITDSRRAEEQLRRTNALLERTEEIVHVGGWEWDIPSDTVTWSKELYRITGLDPDKPPPPFNADHHKIYTEDSWLNLTARVERAIAYGESYELTAQMVRSDGGIRDVVIFGGVWRDVAGTVTGLYGIVQDVTDRLRMEEALRRQKEDLRITLNSIGDAVIATDIQGVVAHMNPVAEELTGWSERKAQGRALTELFLIENAVTGASVENPVASVLKTGAPAELANHTKLLSQNGREYHIADSAAPIRDKNGDLRGVVLVFRDVTEEYELRSSLQSSEERLSTLFHSMREGVCLHEMEYDESGAAVDYRIVDINPAYERIIGLRRDEVIGRLASEIYGSSGAPYLKEYAAIVADGEPRQFEVYFEPLDMHLYISAFATGPDSFGTVFLDISDLKTQ